MTGKGWGGRERRGESGIEEWCVGGREERERRGEVEERERERERER